MVVAVSALLVGGCRGKLVSTAELHAPGAATARFTPVQGKAYRLWADTDGAWTGSSRSHFPVGYDIDVQQGGTSLGRIQCDTRGAGTSVCGSKANIGGEHSGDCEYLLSCRLPPLGAGDVVLHAQARLLEPVKRVDRMSLLVRED